MAATAPAELFPWDTLLRRIRDRRCTPFLGAGASAGYIQTAKQVAQMWADQFNYPLSNRDDLASVAQFLAINVDGAEPKDIFSALCRNADRPDFNDQTEIHRALADLPFPIYITTNYDSFMLEALKRAGKEPQLQYCKWYEKPTEFRSPPKAPPEPTVERPLIYHLHGCCEDSQSMVLTEDDYLDFLISMLRRKNRLLPTYVLDALAGTSLMFIGYSHRDWTFLVLFRALMETISRSVERLSVSVQLPPDETTSEQRPHIQRYFEKRYTRAHQIKTIVHWARASEFAHELRQRWEATHGLQRA